MLSNVDLFKEKLLTAPLHQYMPQYQGSGDFQSASQFMLAHFTMLLKNPNKRLYSHFTCATVSCRFVAVLAVPRSMFATDSVRGLAGQGADSIRARSPTRLHHTQQSQCNRLDLKLSDVSNISQAFTFRFRFRLSLADFGPIPLDGPDEPADAVSKDAHISFVR